MAVTPTQENRLFKVITPLGEDVLLFRRMTGTEQLSRLFEFELDLLSVDQDIVLADLLGQNVTVEMQRFDGEVRHFNGFVSRFSFVDTEHRYALYRAVVRPWLWFLTRTMDCRIFQKQKAPDIIKQVFRDIGFTDFDERLTRNYREWDYCVQYRETAFNFVSRLMELEGIYYFFLHEEGKHTLVLCDSYSAHETYPGYETMPYFPPDIHDHRESDYIYDWSVAHEVLPGRYALNDYNFETPKAMLEVRSAMPRDHAYNDFEVYDYPGPYEEAAEGDEYVRTRIEELQAQYEQIQAKANAGGLCPGFLFTLEGYPRRDQNREYLVTEASYRLESNAYLTTGDAGGRDLTYPCTFSVIDSQQPFRSARITPTPVVQGPQTAVVVGPPGETIHTDNYGRIKVRFFWDRYSNADDRSSCWVRVSQNRAGKGWGEMYVPHVGQEVVVSFLEGDPNRPLVTGRVYNADNMPPLEMPVKKTQLAMRDHGSNEMIMEGDDGAQRITMFSPSGDSRFSMGAGFNPNPGFHWNTADNWTALVGTNQRINIDGDRSLTVKGNEKTHIETNRTVKIDGSNTEKIEGEHKHTDGNKLTWLTYGAENKVNFNAKHSFTFGVDVSEFAGVKTSIQGGYFYSRTHGLKYTVDMAGELNKKPKEIKNVDSSIEHICHGSIDYTALGKMELMGSPVLIEGTGSVTIKVGGTEIKLASGGVSIRASKLSVRGDVNITGNLDVGGTINDK